MITIPQIVQDRCPLWSARIKNHSFLSLGTYFNDGNSLDISSSHHCIVGEAYGFTEKYWHEKYLFFEKGEDYSEKDACEECSYYSKGFYSVIRSIPNRIKFQSMLDEFAEHLELCHNEKEEVVLLEKEILYNEY